MILKNNKMEESNFEQEANQMNLITVYRKQHVIRVVNREHRYIPEPDYLRSGHALVGILNEGETLEQFRKRWIEKKIELEENK